jgi:hypothetical protein
LCTGQVPADVLLGEDSVEIQRSWQAAQMSVERETTGRVDGCASASTSLLIESRLCNLVGRTIEILDGPLKLCEFGEGLRGQL